MSILSTLFKNGQYTFIEPSAMSTDPELARLLGIGGYFLITGVSHTISPSGYNVSVQALQQEMPIGEAALSLKATELAYTINPELNPAIFRPAESGGREWDPNAQKPMFEKPVEYEALQAITNIPGGPAGLLAAMSFFNRK